MPVYPPIKTPRGKIFHDKTGRAKLIWSPGFVPKWSGAFQTLQEALDAGVFKRIEKYMPRRTGRLILSQRLATRIGSGLFKWLVPYGYYLYTGINRFTGRPLNFNGAPMRGAKWFQRMKSAEGQDLIKEAKRAMRGRL
jgi:hypothetical protein